MSRMRLSRVFFLSDEWTRFLDSVCAKDDVEYLTRLYDEWKPVLRSVVKPARNEKELRKAVSELALSFESFNRRWNRSVQEIDIESLNRLREGYNRYYVFEKECALGSSLLAQLGFVKQKPVSAEDLLELFPPLKIPQVS